MILGSEISTELALPLESQIWKAAWRNDHDASSTCLRLCRRLRTGVLLILENQEPGKGTDRRIPHHLLSAVTAGMERNGMKWNRRKEGKAQKRKLLSGAKVASSSQPEPRAWDTVSWAERKRALVRAHLLTDSSRTHPHSLCTSTWCMRPPPSQ